jgi:hypothetical protein
MNRFKKLNKVRSFYEQMLGPLEYQHRLDEVTQLLRERELALAASRVSHVMTQTEPSEIRLSDLPNQDV